MVKNTFVYLACFRKRFDPEANGEKQDAKGGN
jgi:hypothetical protein